VTDGLRDAFKNDFTPVEAKKLRPSIKTINFMKVKTITSLLLIINKAKNNTTSIMGKMALF
jgi:hypothetical protein